MQAIILAAGMGKRLKEYTKNNTKCMVEVNGVKLIDRVLSQLDKLHLSRVVIVVGYEGKKLIDHIATVDVTTPVCYVENPIYDKTNNIYSLMLAKDYLLKEDTLLLESDLIYEDSVLEALVNDERDTLALVDKYKNWMDGTCLKLDEEDNIVDFIPGKAFKFSEMDEYYKTVNIYKFSKEFSKNYYVPFLDAYVKALGDNEYYEQVLKVITMLDNPGIKAKRLDGQLWYEIDDAQDLDIASSMFKEEGKAGALCSRYGGYWRYPGMLDFCYLVNPYFPPRKMMDEMRSIFDTLLTQYPSGMKTIKMLAADFFDVKKEHLIVGNGAAELIKELMGSVSGKVGFIRPTFEEYPNRYSEVERVEYNITNDAFSYDADDIMDFFADKDINSLVLINPDNPSGNYICKSNVIRLSKWCEERNILFIVDESFVDFATEDNSTLIDEEILENNKSMIVVKSISKSYGVPGLRLGVMASHNEELLQVIDAKTSIWNINSFAEYFLQIVRKYKKDYEKSLVKIKDSRKKFIDALMAISDITVIPSEANYIMVGLKRGTANELLDYLLKNHNTLIKSLSSKTGGREYIRLAVKTVEENNRIVEGLKGYFSEL